MDYVIDKKFKIPEIFCFQDVCYKVGVPNNDRRKEEWLILFQIVYRGCHTAIHIQRRMPKMYFKRFF